MGSVSGPGGKLPAVKHSESLGSRQAGSHRDHINGQHHATDRIGALNRAGQRSTSVINTSSDVCSQPVGGRSKRAFDVLVAGTSLIVMAPLMLIIAGIIAVTMGRPVLFVQQRVGFNSKVFGRYKFRTTVIVTDVRSTCNLRHRPELPYWSETQKSKDDPCVTWVGHVLLKSSLDKLPQLFNVLRGEMSCIGPHPIPIKELVTRYGRAAEHYARARPGLISMRQVWNRRSTAYARSIAYDRIYIRRWSLLLDMNILFRTVLALSKPTSGGTD